MKLNLAKIESDAREGQEAVARLLDQEESAMARWEEVAQISEPIERLEQAASLIEECDSIVTLAKELIDVLARVKKRMDGVIEKTKGAVLTEVESFENKRAETKSHVLVVRDNPPSVVVDDLAVIPKKYRREPAPLPPVDQWPPDKNSIKEALIKEKVKAIAGVHLDQSTRLEIKPR